MRGNLIDAQAVRAEMERVLASSRFAKSQRLSRFLRFLVEHAITGGPRLDEYSIAAEVFGRPASFVSQLDPVVRVQLRRLRAALLQYYEAEGRANPVMLEAPERGYGLVVLDPATDGPTHRRGKLGKFVACAAALAICAALWLHFRPHRTDPRAVQLERRARDLRAKGTLSDVALSEGLFEQAVALDSGYAPAWSGLADVLLFSGPPGAMTRSEAIAKASQAAREAIKLDPRIAEAHAALAYLRFFRDADWAGAEPEFRRAIQLDPAAARIHRLYAQGLMSRGRFDEAIAQSKTAASLDPAGSPPSTDLAEILSAARRDDEAIVEARRIVQETAGAPAARLALGISLAAAGHYDESIPELQAGLSLYAMARLGYAYGAKGDRAAAGAVLDRLDEAFAQAVSINWSYRALVYAGLGDGQHAVDCMEKSLVNQEGDINFIGVDPAYDKIRSDLGFVALRKRLGLP